MTTLGFMTVLDSTDWPIVEARRLPIAEIPGRSIEVCDSNGSFYATQNLCPRALDRSVGAGEGLFNVENRPISSSMETPRAIIPAIETAAAGLRRTLRQ